MADARKFSPFSPSSRHFLNPLYIALDKVPGADKVLAEMVVPAEMRDAKFVDYAAVGPLKLKALTFLFRAFRETGEPDAPRRNSPTMSPNGGRPLYLHALFEALSQAMVEDGHAATWHGWPEEYRHPASRAVTAFAAAHAEAIAFHSLAAVDWPSASLPAPRPAPRPPACASASISTWRSASPPTARPPGRTAN